MIIVPVGASSMTFNINVQNVPVTTPVTISAAYDDVVQSKTLTINGSSVSLSSVTLNVSTLSGGQGGVGFVNLSAPAPSGHVLVTLSANNPAVSLPTNVTVSAGSTQGLFSFGASPVTATTPATITAAFGASTASANVTINPGVTVGVTSLALSPSTVPAGGSSTATVTLSGPAPTGGAAVQLSGTSPATVPSTIIVPAGATSATFNVGTTSTPSTVQAPIWAVLNTTWGAVLTVTSGTSTPTLSAIALSPANVVGGNNSQGTVTLTSAAPSGGTVVALSSSNTAVATVPPSVTVAAGSTSRTFTVTTSPITSSTPVTITGTAGATRTSALTVTPPSTTTPAAPSLVSPANAAIVTLPVLLDWNDVNGAVSYQVQIDDSSAFSTPLVVDQPVTASQFSASTLAPQQHWWRVRGVNSAGTAGAWSTVRSLTPQAGGGGQVSVTVVASGRSGNRITSAPAGLNVLVGSSGTAAFPSGTAITLSVSDGRDAVWSGACSSGGNKTKTCRFTPTANTTVNANVQ
jgi:hypothetical protein